MRTMEGYLCKEISSRRLLRLLLVLVLLCCGLGFEVGDGAVGDPLCRVVLFIVDVRAAIPEREMRERWEDEREGVKKGRREKESREMGRREMMGRRERRSEEREGERRREKE